MYQEPDLIERVVRDWLTEEIDRVVIDDDAAFERIGRPSRRGGVHGPLVGMAAVALGWPSR